MRHNLRIAIDYDGTIADTNAVKADWIRQNLGVNVPSWKCDRTSCIPIIGSANYEAMGKFVYGDEATSTAEPVQQAVWGVESLVSIADLYVLTNRCPSNIVFAERWLEAQGISDLFKTVLSSADRSKIRICEEHGINILFDDDIRHLVGVENSRPSVVLFRPDPHENCLSADAVEAKSWQEFVTYVIEVSRKNRIE